mgnify:CR=1 FL=1
MSSFINLFFRNNKTALACCLTFACLCGAVFRFEQWFDFFNYHYYNVWAFFNNRANIDVVPAFINTFFSPFADIPMYWLINALNDNPVIFSTIMAAPYGFMLFIVYKTAALFFSPDDRDGRIKIIMVLLLCVCSTNTASQISTTTNDLTLSVFVLTAVYLLLKDILCSRRQKTYPAAGFLLGAVSGLKLTFCPYAAAAGITLCLFYKQLKSPLKTIFLFSAAVTAGFLITYGYWGWTLWKNYQNPFFPFFNSVFHSPYWQGENYKDLRYFNKSTMVLFFYPFFMFCNLGSEIPLVSILNFSYLRYLTAYAAFICFSARFLKEKRKFPPALNRFSFLTVWLCLVYILWLLFYRVDRYLISFEALLSIILIRFFFEKEELSWKNKKVKLFLIFIFIVSLFLPFSNYKRPVSEPLLPIRHTSLPKNSLLLISGSPAAIFIPLLVSDSTTRAVIHPVHRDPINGSDFYTSGFFSEKRYDILIPALEKPEKNIFILAAFPENYYETHLKDPELSKYTIFSKYTAFSRSFSCEKLHRTNFKISFYLCRLASNNIHLDNPAFLEQNK